MAKASVQDLKGTRIATERLLTGYTKVIFDQGTLDIGIRTVDIFNKVLLEITKHAFPVRK